MKKFFCYASAVIVVLFSVASTCDSPIVGDHSGAPGETTCSGCHSAPVNPDLPNLHFEVGSNDSTYIPGNTYLVHLYIIKPGHNKFGFVCSSLDSLNTSKGTFNLINTTTTRKYTMGGRNYISHTPCGADAVDSISWTFNWKAPDTSKGRITMYMSMLVANHDHALTGDTTYTRQISLKPNTANGVNELQSAKANVYPTVFCDVINIDFNPQFGNSPKQVSLISSDGRIISQISTVNPSIKFITPGTISNGLYLLKISYGTFSEVVKVIKQ